MNLEKLHNDLSKIELHNEKDINKMKMILAEIQTEIINTGKLNKGIISNFKKFTKNNVSIKPLFAQIYQSANDNYVLCNGFALLDYGTDINNIPLELHSYVDYLLQKYEKPTIDYDRLAPKNTKTTTIKLENIEKMVKYNKTRKDTRIPIEINNIFLDPEILLEMLSILAFKNPELKIAYGAETTPITFEYNGVKAMLLPIKHYKQEFEEEVYRINKQLFGE